MARCYHEKRTYDIRFSWQEKKLLPTPEARQVRSSDIQRRHVQRVLLDEFAARLGMAGISFFTRAGFPMAASRFGIRGS
jgi:hypothetical protein